MKQHGFTLLEMVIGITLLGFVLMLVYGGLRLATMSWDKGELAMAVAARQSVVTGFLTRAMERTYPLRWKQDDGVEVLAFDGEAESIHFAAPHPARMGGGGVNLFVLDTLGDGEDRQLRLRWRLPDPAIKSFDFPDDPPTSILARDIRSVSFAYYGAESVNDSPAWHDAWQGKNMLPDLIRIRVTPASGDPWPEIRIRPRLSPESACRWDDWHKRCIE